MFKQIQSAQNETYKMLESLLASKGIKKERRFLLFGEKAIAELTQEMPERIFAIVTTSHYLENAESLLQSLSSDNHERMTKMRTVHGYELHPPLFQELDVFGTRAPFAVVDCPQLQEFTGDKEPGGLEIITNLQDPSNLGALIRSAAAFDATVVLLKDCANPFHPKSTRAASGTLFKVHLKQGPGLEEILMQKTVKNTLWGLDAKGTNIFDFQFPKNMRLVIGQEGAGIHSQLKQQSLAIPMQNGVESLNAMVSASLAMFQYRGQHRTN